ncbi:hypothetical protein MCEL_00820 [Mycolicibacterium celeriflavum]|uniref:DNA-binding protein n=1 Tax=Mycolicibacterium celeriflavum TaxID=1249101 RepID=A0A7I7RBB4_MYCCF|nr:hypothetical protein MCEL_00820 [Mycolicibacterium celeriflavum]
MEMEHTADEEPDGESASDPEDSVPRRRLPAVGSAADRLTAGRAWVTNDAGSGIAEHLRIDHYLAASPSTRSAFDALTVGPKPIDLAPALPVWHQLQSGPRLTDLTPTIPAWRELDAGPKLTEIVAEATARTSETWQELLSGPKLKHLMPAVPIWEKLNVGPSLAQMAAEAAARTRDALGIGPGSRTHGVFGRSGVGTTWEGLQSRVSDLTSSFAPRSDSVLTGLSDVTSGFAAKMLAGPELSAARLFSTDHLAGVSSWIGAAGHRSWMDGVSRAPGESIAKMLQSFSTLADRGVTWGWRALMATLRAQRAVLRGDIEAIVRFMREWLGFKSTPHTLVDAASAVLLEEAVWLPAGLEADDKVCPLIRKLTVDEHRNFRLIGDTQIGGQRVDALDRPVSVRGEPGATAPLVETVAAPSPGATMDDISDPRLLWIIGKLDDRERMIFRMKGQEERTWADAAVSCGLAPAAGQKLGRKVTRLGNKAYVELAATAAQAAG